MITLSTGISLVLGFVAKLILGWLSDQRAAAAQKQIGDLEAKLEQATAAQKAAEKMADEAGKQVSEDDAIGRLGEGSA